MGIEVKSWEVAIEGAAEGHVDAEVETVLQHFDVVEEAGFPSTEDHNCNRVAVAFAEFVVVVVAV
eukprot:m.217699 g.217699  ORF g.217699 m.217699 type:complete len:65 (-) comp13812_c0_seq16:1845-2039(-)